MEKRTVLGNLALLAFSAALAACGNMNAVIAKDSSYNLDAYVGARNLDDGATINSADSIRPSFSSEAEDDPDVMGIKVSLETEAGALAASDVVYRLSADKSARGLEESPVLVPRFSGELPAFGLPADLPVGRYVLVMQVLGADGALFERRRSVYYLADAQLTLNRVVSYPPGSGTSSTAPLFPTNAKLLLKAEVTADARLDPYVAWYFGTKRISIGRLADGANQILWTAPSREGFQTVRVEVYPEPPANPKEPGVVGASADLTVATADSAPIPGFPGAGSDFVHLYHFLGDLSDAADAADAGRTFVRTNGGELVWVPLEDSYGLSLGANEEYRLETPLVPIRSGGIDPSRIRTRVAISGSGPVWRASFPAVDGSEGLRLELFAVPGGLELRLVAGAAERKAFVAVRGETADEAADVEVTLSVRAASALATIAADGRAVAEATLALSAPLYGSGSVRLGGASNSLDQGDGAIAQYDSGTGGSLRTAVIDELAVVPESSRLAENANSR